MSRTTCLTSLTSVNLEKYRGENFLVWTQWRRTSALEGSLFSSSFLGDRRQESSGGKFWLEPGALLLSGELPLPESVEEARLSGEETARESEPETEPVTGEQAPVLGSPESVRTLASVLGDVLGSHPASIMRCAEA